MAEQAQEAARAAREPEPGDTWVSRITAHEVLVTTATADVVLARVWLEDDLRNATGQLSDVELHTTRRNWHALWHFGSRPRWRTQKPMLAGRDAR